MTSLVWIALVPDATACGGFFCNNDPIDQAAEDVVFAIDEQAGEVTMHVQIAYTGTAEEFAWIVPVAAEPELLLSTTQLFDTMRWGTRPWFQLETEEVGDCDDEYDYWGYPEAADGSYSASSSTVDSGGATTVQVVSEQRVGPYETVVLTAQNADGLIDWLQANKYVLPDELSKVLAPYIVEGGNTHFVALRLAKDTDVGELTPLALTYPGTIGSIPIQLTAIAATEDMRLRAYVLGEHRSVPQSYFHVQVNDIVVDWFRGGNNWEDAITIAADEAGGHAFATDYSGPSNILDDLIYIEGTLDTTRLAKASGPVDFFRRLMSEGFRGDATLLGLFRKYLPLPEELASQGVSEQSFYNNLDYYSEHLEGVDFDAAAFAADIEERIVAPRRNAQEMVDSFPHLTRMTSSVSPVEMDVDPTFVFNADMPQTVAQGRSATVEIHCANGGRWTEVPRRLVLADGRAFNLPSMQWFWDNGMTEYEYLADVRDDYALVIQNTGAEGEGEVVYDGTEAARAAADEFNERNGIQIVRQVAGCAGCQSSTPAGLGLGLLALVALGRRRRA